MEDFAHRLAATADPIMAQANADSVTLYDCLNWLRAALGTRPGYAGDAMALLKTRATAAD